MVEGVAILRAGAEGWEGISVEKYLGEESRRWELDERQGTDLAEEREMLEVTIISVVQPWTYWRLLDV